jgi:hypothetical protein
MIDMIPLQQLVAFAPDPIQQGEDKTPKKLTNHSGCQEILFKLSLDATFEDRVFTPV